MSRSYASSSSSSPYYYSSAGNSSSSQPASTTSYANASYNPSLNGSYSTRPASATSYAHAYSNSTSGSWTQGASSARAPLSSRTSHSSSSQHPHPPPQTFPPVYPHQTQPHYSQYGGQQYSTAGMGGQFATNPAQTSYNTSGGGLLDGISYSTASPSPAAIERVMQRSQASGPYTAGNYRQ